jgi:hypothetical protein
VETPSPNIQIGSVREFEYEKLGRLEKDRVTTWIQYGFDRASNRQWRKNVVDEPVFTKVLTCSRQG